MEPLPLAESNRSVQVIQPREALPGTDSVVDLLRSDPSLNLQARAGEGVQADLAIRGTTFEQSLVLVNGLRVDDPGNRPPEPRHSRAAGRHHACRCAAWFGLHVLRIGRNWRRGKPADRSARRGVKRGGTLWRGKLRLAGGTSSCGLLGRPICRAVDRQPRYFRRIHTRPQLQQQRACQRELAEDCAGNNRCSAGDQRPALRREPVLWHTPRGSAPRDGWPACSSSLARARRPASATGGTATCSCSSRAQPAIYENNHITTSYEGALRRADELGKNSTLAYGLEESGDSIQSFNFSQGSSGGSPQ